MFLEGIGIDGRTVVIAERPISDMLYHYLFVWQADIMGKQGIAGASDGAR